jgi:very-short-patch-repair endonuclease
MRVRDRIREVGGRGAEIVWLKCQYCGVDFWEYKSALIKRGEIKYHSRRCTSLGRKGTKAWNKGKKGCFTADTIKKMSVAAIKRGDIPEAHTPEVNIKRGLITKQRGSLKKKWQEPEFRNKLLNHLKELNQSPEHRISSAKGAKTTRIKHPEILEKFLQKGHERMRTAEGREYQSRIAKEQWKRMKTEMVMAQRRGMKRPNKKETQLCSILDKYFPDQWKYVGSGKLVIENLVPDFINCNGKKLIIEFFGDYWHGPKATQPYRKESERREVYSRYGYGMLVIWEHELKELSEKEIVNKVNTLIKEYDNEHSKV